MDAKRIVGGVIAVVVLVLVGVVSYKYGTKKVVVENSDGVAKQAAAEFVDALVKGEVDETYELGSTAYQAKNSKERVKEISDSLKSDKPQVADEEIFFGKDQATNQAIYLSSVSNLPANSYGRTTGNFVIRLVVQDGTWKVDSSQVF
jgi:hypothetical protein